MDIEYMDREEVSATAHEIVKALHEVGTRLVCIDFDSTFVNVHTGGMWESSAHHLTNHVRPMFLELIPLVSNAGMNVAVVTFSPQVELIRDVLCLCFPSHIADNILIRGDDESWAVTRGNFTSFALEKIDEECFASTHKLPYIVSAAIDAGMRNDGRIKNFETVLIDDDPDNIQMANKYGIGAIRFCPEEPDAKALCESIKNLQITDCPTTTILPTATTSTIITHTKTPQRKSSSKHNSPLDYKDEFSHLKEKIIDTPLSKNRLQEQIDDESTNGKKKTFQFFTPSPVMKLKCEQVVRRPRMKRQPKLSCSRNIDETLEELHITVQNETPLQ